MEQDPHVSDPKPKLLVVVGSTGVGKTKLGVALAKQFNGEVVSCDSMQIYKVNSGILISKISQYPLLSKKTLKRVEHILNNIFKLQKVDIATNKVTSEEADGVSPLIVRSIS